MSSNEKKARGKFTSEYRLQAVKRVLAGQPVAVVARKLGIGGNNLLPLKIQPAPAGTGRPPIVAVFFRVTISTNKPGALPKVTPALPQQKRLARKPWQAFVLSGALSHHSLQTTKTKAFLMSCFIDAPKYAPT